MATNFTLNPELVQSHVVRQLESWVDSLPESARSQAVVAASGDGTQLSPQDILTHVQLGTDLGVQLMEHAAALAIADGLIETA